MPGNPNLARKCPKCKTLVAYSEPHCPNCGYADSQPSIPGPQPKAPYPPLCPQCQIPMRHYHQAKHSQLVALLFIAVGIICCFTCAGIIIGIPLVLIGLLLGSGSNYYWNCPSCNALIPRKSWYRF